MSKGVVHMIKNLNSEVKSYLNQLITDGEKTSKTVHPMHAYPQKVSSKNAYRQYGVFMDYLVRKEIYSQLDKKATDFRAEECKAALEKYDKEIQDCRENETCREYYDENGKLLKEHHVVEIGLLRSIWGRRIETLKELLLSYVTFVDENETKLIIKEIYDTSMLHMMYFGDPVINFVSEFINYDHINDVLEYVSNLKLEDIKINPKFENEYFQGDADLVFSDAIMDIKTSMIDYDADGAKSKFYQDIHQLLFYALGFYIQNGKEIKIFKIYNPLLGKETTLNLVKHLDFDEFLKRINDTLCWTLDRK